MRSTGGMWRGTTPWFWREGKRSSSFLTNNAEKPSQQAIILASWALFMMPSCPRRNVCLLPFTPLSLILIRKFRRDIPCRQGWNCPTNIIAAHSVWTWVTDKEIKRWSSRRKMFCELRLAKRLAKIYQTWWILVQSLFYSALNRRVNFVIEDHEKVYCIVTLPRLGWIPSRLR